MSPVGILLVSTGEIADETSRWARTCLGKIDHLDALCLSIDDGWESAMAKLEDRVRIGDRGEGVLILTDMEGGTPYNLAKALLPRAKVAVIAGTNIPMLFKAVQLSAALPLEPLVEQIVSYGRAHITGCVA